MNNPSTIEIYFFKFKFALLFWHLMFLFLTFISAIYRLFLHWGFFILFLCWRNFNEIITVYASTVICAFQTFWIAFAVFFNAAAFLTWTPFIDRLSFHPIDWLLPKGTMLVILTKLASAHYWAVLAFCKAFAI